MGEREALACLWACEHWHVYLYPFTIRTDPQALTALLATQGSGHRPMRLLRWADRLNQDNFSLEFMPGRANTVADLLSRAVSVTKEMGGVSSDPESDDWVHILHGPDRLNKTLKNGIRACLEEGKTFSDALNQTLLTIRASKHSTT